jgi:hypothetical protein
MSEDPVFVLTRYLYIKDDVWASLMMSILNKDIEQTMFWTCEMYHSGFEEELAEYLLVIYIEFFRSKNPRLESHLRAWSTRILEGAHIAATMARNLAAYPRKKTVTNFDTAKLDDDIHADSKFETRLLIHVSPAMIEKYTTIYKDDTLKRPARKILAQACLYSTCKNMAILFQANYVSLDFAQMSEYHRMDHHWLYFASFSPVWKRRILEFKGIIDDTTSRVDFPDEESLEAFFEEFGYEPDEQAHDVSGKIMHMQHNQQMTMKEFCCIFNKTKIVRVNKKQSTLC